VGSEFRSPEFWVRVQSSEFIVKLQLAGEPQQPKGGTLSLAHFFPLAAIRCFSI
jgi:hypothetical protein